MQLNSKWVVPVGAVALIAGTIFGVTVGTKVLAQSNEDGANFPPIVQKLVDKFDLSESDVKISLDELHEDRRAEMEARYEERLNQAVEDGDLTEDKKNLIVSKHKELMSAMQQQHDELQQWASDNQVDLKYLGRFHMGGPFGKKMFHHRMEPDN
jgi:hypothetical protein